MIIPRNAWEMFINSESLALPRCRRWKQTDNLVFVYDFLLLIQISFSNLELVHLLFHLMVIKWKLEDRTKLIFCTFIDRDFFKPNCSETNLWCISRQNEFFQIGLIFRLGNARKLNSIQLFAINIGFLCANFLAERHE